MPPEPESDTISAEAIAVQVIQENPELSRRYSSGDLSVLSVLLEKTVKLGGARVSELALKETLVRKLSASI